MLCMRSVSRLPGFNSEESHREQVPKFPVEIKKQAYVDSSFIHSRMRLYNCSISAV